MKYEFQSDSYADREWTEGKHDVELAHEGACPAVDCERSPCPGTRKGRLGVVKLLWGNGGHGQDMFCHRGDL